MFLDELLIALRQESSEVALKLSLEQTVVYLRDMRNRSARAKANGIACDCHTGHASVARRTSM